MTIMINSCSKEGFENQDNNSGQPIESGDLLSFKNAETLNEEINKVLAMNYNELKAYEESKGYESFGRKCDEIYNSINPEDFKSLDEIKSFVEKYNEYLIMVDEGNGEFSVETVLESNPYRYFINTNKLFQVNNSVYKLFEDGIVSTDVNNISQLATMTNKEILNIENNDKFRFMPAHTSNDPDLKNALVNCGYGKSDTKTDGNNRTKVEFGLYYLDTYDIDGNKMTIFENRVLVKPQKRTLGGWFGCERTIYCDFKIAVDYETTSGWERDYYRVREWPKKTTKVEVVLEGGIVSWGYWSRYNMYYGSYDCYGDTPSAPEIHFQCEEYLVNSWFN